MLPRRDLALTLAVCGACGPRWVKESVELEPGECAAARATAGGTCTRDALNRTIVATAGVPVDDRSTAGGRAMARWRAFEMGLDARGVRRSTIPEDPSSYASFAPSMGLHASLLAFWPALYRYADVAPVLGADLGVLKFDREIKLRADWWWGAEVELYAPDFGPFAYLGQGVPGLHFGIRRIDYAAQWSSSWVVDVGVVWRWGKPIEVHTYKYFRMMAD